MSLLRTVARLFWDLVKSTALYLAVVAGGLTVFLIVSPLFGYLPYSDRPGPGWFSRFPGIGWTDFWDNAWHMLGFGLFIALLIAIGGAVSVLFVRAVERTRAPVWLLRSAGGLMTAVVTGYFTLGAGWYIALSQAGVVVAMLLGAVAGALVLPHPRIASPAKA